MHPKVTSPVERVDKQDFYLYKTLKKIHALVQSEIQKQEKLNLLLVLNTPGSLEHFMIHTDQRYFQEVFHHLLGHVLKRSDKGCIEFGYKLLENDQFCFYVNDTGSAQPKPSMNHHDSHETALSLLCVKEVVKRLGGKTWIESTPDKISSYWFTVDLQPANTTMHTEPANLETGQNPDWSDKTILIVEDVYNNFLLLETILQRTKAKVINVENGLKAVNTVKRLECIDFVLMDLRLPVLDGFEATSRIKAFKPWLPIIAISAYNVGEEYARCIQAGCNAFIRKPLNTNLLMDTMSKLFQQYDRDKQSR
jgi:CheY-like chemotaxis protein